MNETQALAAAILQSIGPDPNAAEHVATLQRAIGMHCTTPGCTSDSCGVHHPDESRARMLEGGLVGNAASVERFARQQQDRIEEVEWLLEQRTDPAAAADRLGLAAGTLAKSLARAGRHDLARPFWRVDRLQQLGTCRFCGGDTSRKTNTCCQQCRPLAAMETINARRAS